MTAKGIGLVLGGLALLALLGMAGYSYLQEFKQRVTLEAKLAVTNAQLAELQTAYRTSQQATKQKVSAVKAQVATVTTPEQAIAAIPDVSGLPITFHRASGLEEYALAPQDVITLFKGLADCRQKDILLGACQVERANLEQQTKILTDQRDSAVSAVRGGTFWQKFINNSKWLLIGAGTGAVAYAAVRH